MSDICYCAVCVKSYAAVDDECLMKKETKMSDCQNCENEGCPVCWDEYTCQQCRVTSPDGKTHAGNCPTLKSTLQPREWLDPHLWNELVILCANTPHTKIAENALASVNKLRDAYTAAQAENLELHNTLRNTCEHSVKQDETIKQLEAELAETKQSCDNMEGDALTYAEQVKRLQSDKAELVAAFELAQAKVEHYEKRLIEEFHIHEGQQNKIAELVKALKDIVGSLELSKTATDQERIMIRNDCINIARETLSKVTK